MPVGEQAIMPDALEAGRQRVDEKAANELVRFQRHHAGPLFVFMTVILPLEGDFVVPDGEKPLVGKGDPVGVPAEIFESPLRASKGWFGIDHPFAAFLSRQALGKGKGILERDDLATEKQLALIERVFQRIQKEPSEETGQHFYRQEEAGAACKPAFMVRRKAPTGHDAMYVR